MLNAFSGLKIRGGPGLVVNLSWQKSVLRGCGGKLDLAEDHE